MKKTKEDKIIQLLEQILQQLNNLPTHTTIIREIQKQEEPTCPRCGRRGMHICGGSYY